MSLFQPLWQPAATTAATIPFTPSGGLTEPTVEGALIELDTKKLAIADIDDAPVNGVTNAPISSNWAYDHAASATAHAAPASQAEMQAGTESAVRSLSPLRVAEAIAALAPDNYAKYLVALNFGALL